MKVTSTMFKTIASLIAGAALAFMPVATTHAAASATVFVSPANATYTTGNTFSVAIYEDSGDNDVDSARANLTYDASKLEATGITTGDFTTCVTSPSASGGNISTGDCTILGAKKRGQQRLATVTFKAIAEGTAAVNFTSAKVVNAGTDLPVTMVNGNFTIAAPAQGGMGGGSTTGDTSGSNNSNNTSNNVATTGNTGSTAGNNTDNTATDDANKGETKAETTNNSDKKNDATNSANENVAKKEGRNWWPTVIILLIAVAAAVYAYRNRSAGTSVQEDEAPKVTKKPVAAEEAIAAAPIAKKATDHSNKPAQANRDTQNTNKGNAHRGKKSNKRNR